MSRSGDGVSQVVDIGCGDGALIRALAQGVGSGESEVAEAHSRATAHPDPPPDSRFFGLDRNLGRAIPDPNVTYVTSLDEIPPADARLIISNELFDALPFARLVQRGEHLHELWVTERDGALDWSEHEADARYDDYFAERGIKLDDGQFADVSLEWAALYDDLCRFTNRGLIVTFDYGLPQSKLFRGRMRRFGTAAAYSKQRVSRDLLINPGEQDLTAHINFDDLRRTGEGRASTTLFFDRPGEVSPRPRRDRARAVQADRRRQRRSATKAWPCSRRATMPSGSILPDGIGATFACCAGTRDGAGAVAFSDGIVLRSGGRANPAAIGSARRPALNPNG